MPGVAGDIGRLALVDWSPFIKRNLEGTVLGWAIKGAYLKARAATRVRRQRVIVNACREFWIISLSLMVAGFTALQWLTTRYQCSYGRKLSCQIPHLNQRLRS